MRGSAPAIALVILLTLVSSCAFGQATQPADAQTVPRVLIISVDGCRPDLILRGLTPRIKGLYESGSYSFWARTTAASITLPSHVSMLTGVDPDVHGITWNDDLPLAQPVYPKVQTLFDLAKKRGYTTALVAGKRKFNIFERPGAIDWAAVSKSPTCDDPEVVRNALQILRDHRPEVMFVHFAGVDNVGHAKGWASAQQFEAMEIADQCVGALLDALDELQLRDRTVIIFTSDHGGAGRTHGPDDARSRTIPWIIAGPGIRKNFDLPRLQDLDIDTYDTFATACALLNITIDRRVRGKFVSQILEKRELLRSATTQPVAGH